MKNVVILGKGSLAIETFEWFRFRCEQYRIIAVVPVPNATWDGDLAQWARDRRATVIESGSWKDISHNIEIDLAVSIFYDKILPASFLLSCKRAINLHNSALPANRGVLPVNWALKNEEKIHGVTIHEMDAGIDTGDIISQVTFPICCDVDEVRDVYARSMRYGKLLLQDTLPLLDALVPYKQDESRSSYHNSKQNHLLCERLGLTRRS